MKNIFRLNAAAAALTLLMSTVACHKTVSTAIKTGPSAMEPAPKVEVVKPVDTIRTAITRIRVLATLMDTLELKPSQELLKQIFELDRKVGLVLLKRLAPDHVDMLPTTLVRTAADTLETFNKVKTSYAARTIAGIETDAKVLTHNIEKETNIRLDSQIEQDRQKAKKSENETTMLLNSANSMLALAELTLELSKYKKATGAYPAVLEDLVPEYIKAVPELKLPGHAATSQVRVIDTLDFDGDIGKAVKDTGGWIYFSNPKSKYYGNIMLDSSHKAPPDGKEFYKIGEGTGAETVPATAPLQEPESPFIDARRYFSEGASYSANPAEALKAFENAIQADPSYAKAYVWKGLSHITLKQNKQGARSIEKALELEPDYPFALMVRARLYVEQADPERALADLTRACSLTGKTDADIACRLATELRGQIAFISRARVYQERGDLKRALAELDQACSLTGKTFGAQAACRLAANLRGQQ